MNPDPQFSRPPFIPVPSGLETECFALAPGALEVLPAILRAAFPGRRPLIVADDNTFRAAGSRAQEMLNAAGMNPYAPHCFPGTPRLHPEFSYCEVLAAKFPSDAVPVAIGSGVINDLTKCGANLRHLRYCCVPTACSVDGYTASGAALVVNGSKKTVKCPAPLALCADTEILRTAPPDMLASGFADLLTKIPAGADWIIADAAGVEPIRADVWDLIQGRIFDWTADAGDMMRIFDGLAATGYAMQMYGDSRPASGAEHLFSHVWEMEGLTRNGEDVSHGFKVGVGLLASTLLMEFVLEHGAAEIRAMMRPGLSVPEREREIDGLLRRGCYGAEPRITALKKFLTGPELARRRETLLTNWDAMRERMRARLIPCRKMREKLRRAGCPTTPEAIGLDAEQFRHGIRTAQLIRNRYTVLDLLYELGLLETAMAEKLPAMLA
ncbi:MAG: sn-glycerol-1-phosphate dehydrogenase [Lentisphaeria bacterium]|nr:sn-glycerol-1-phosphate dehydrogenase [Lentisphaeria bacterium]